MASTKFRPLLIILALASAGCNVHRDRGAQSSVTVNLPPARPAAPRPGFTAEATDKVAQPDDDRASVAVHDLAASLR
jgi:hypothetical protein